MYKFNQRTLIIFFITTLSILITFLIPRFAQPISYHYFADTRPLFGITNCLNVISNLMFIIVGIIGIKVIFSKTTCFINSKEKYPYVMFFMGAILVGLGSGYYHLNPNNTTLFWDRVPINIVITSYFCVLLTERVSVKWGNILLIPLLIISIGSVIYWEYSEIINRGDLRFYGLTQFYSIIMVIFILFAFKPFYSHTRLIFLTLFLYLIAKLGEFFDYGIYNFTYHLISGHTIKHLAAALAIYVILKYLKQRHIL